MSLSTVCAFMGEIKTLRSEINDISSLMSDTDKQIRFAMDDVVGLSAEESIKKIKAEFDHNFAKGIECLQDTADRISAGYNRIQSESDDAYSLIMQAESIKGALGKYE